MGILIAWVALGFWHAVKPLPPGVRVASAFRRMGESDLDFVALRTDPPDPMARQLAMIDHAEQLVVLDESPVPRELAQALLVRKHVRPNLKVVVLTDPADSIQGSAPAQDLLVLERAGIVVVRVDLDRLRDSNPFYSGFWRLALGWWSDPFAEKTGLRAAARRLNFKADARQLIVTDDGSGAWTSMLGSAYENPGLIVRGGLAGDILASELKIAAWSTEDDRLPSTPPAADQRVGTIDARFLSEGAIAAALLDAVHAAEAGDQISVAVHHLGERRLIDAALAAAARGALVRLLLDADPQPNQAVAWELARYGGGNLEVRWRTEEHGASTQLILIRHRADLAMFLTSASMTRRDLADFNLESCVELRLAVHAVSARSAMKYFSSAWSAARKYAWFADESSAGYWLYRFKEASGLSSF